MTEHEAIERIAHQLDIDHSMGQDFARIAAETAWNEMKAIAREIRREEVRDELLKAGRFHRMAGPHTA